MTAGKTRRYRIRCDGNGELSVQQRVGWFSRNGTLYANSNPLPNWQSLYCHHDGWNWVDGQLERTPHTMLDCLKLIQDNEERLDHYERSRRYTIEFDGSAAQAAELIAFTEAE